MLDIFTQYATDENLENNGSWFPVGKGSRLLVARAGNQAYGRLLTKLVDQHRVVLDGEDAEATTLSDSIMIDVMAETVLLGWEGVGFKGVELPYTLDNAKKMLRVKDFRKRVTAFSEDASAFKFKLEEAQGKA